MQQQTLRSPCLIHGVGIHSGEEVSISLLPAPIDTGILFRAHHAGRQVEIPARSEFISGNNLNTALGRSGVEISTVEHILAALAGLDIDNATILVHGTEIPAMDGSALPFVERIMEVGRQMQSAPRSYLKVLETISVDGGDKFAGLFPSKTPSFFCEIDFPHPAVGKQSRKIEVNAEIFISEVAGARTFGFEEDLYNLRARGLALGAGLENTVGLAKDGSILNGGGLRFPDEFVRHKLLDAMGDLSLVGRPILAEYRGYKAGHALNQTLLQALADQPDSWKIISGQDLADAQAG